MLNPLFMVYVKLLLMAIFWGGTFIAARVAAQEVGPFSGAFLRFAIASIFLLFALLRVEKKFPPVSKAQWLPLIFLGLTGVFAYNVLFFKGLKLIEAGRASVIIANNPIFIALFSALIFRERLSVQKILGILLSVSGALVVITKGDFASLGKSGISIGDLYIFGCVASWVAYSLMGKTAMKSFSPLTSVTYSTLIGTLALLTPALCEGMAYDVFAYSGKAWLSLFFLGVCGTFLGFVWYYQGIQQIGPTKAGLFINFVPISAILMAAVILKESLTYSLLIGLILVSTGVYLTNKK